MSPPPSVAAILAERARVVTRAAKARIVGSLAVHGIVAGALILVPVIADGGAEPTPEYVPVFIMPVQALGVPEPTPARSRRPEPPPPAPAAEEEPAPKPAPEPAMPAPEPKPERRRESEPARPAESSPWRSEPEPAGGDFARRRGSPTGSSTGTNAFGASIDFGGIDFPFSYYTDQVLALIGAQWNRPALGGTVETVVFFRIRRDGRLSDLKVLDSSGYNVFDLAALRAVQLAAPFPRLPESFAHDSLAIRLYVR